MVGKRRGRRFDHLSWAVLSERRALWTRNADPGNTTYGESLRRIEDAEHRRWDPNRSKLAAAIIKTSGDRRDLLPEPGSEALYLGAGHGTTVSHVHDHLCGLDNEMGGRLVAVDLAPRCLRDLTHLARSRRGLVPVLGDARRYTAWGSLLPSRVMWLFQDVAQAGQVDIFLGACDRFLELGGSGLLSLKAMSERWSEDGEQGIFSRVEERIVDHGLEMVEAISLSGFEENHVLFHVRRSS